MSNTMHQHKFSFDSKIENAHKHKILGITEKIYGFKSMHIHFYKGICSYNDHTHSFRGITSIPTNTENGHIHLLQGFLEMSKEHTHKYKDYTLEDIEYKKSSKSIRLIIDTR